MGTLAQRFHESRSHGITRAAALAGTIGASVGLAAGLAELTVGPSIRSWVGSKADTTRLGLATLALAGLALVAALTLLRRPRAPAPNRLGLAVGLLIPGVICFTTVGRLWYLPGVLLVGAGIATVVDVRKERSEVATTLGRNWTAVLTVVLGAFYVFLGATALGLAGILGMLEGCSRSRSSRRAARFRPRSRSGCSLRRRCHSRHSRGGASPRP
jgi:hypothetical protein